MKMSNRIKIDRKTPGYREVMREVLRNPGSDYPRRVFADWAERNGYKDRAEFVRVQLELARTIYQRCPLHAGDGCIGGRKLCRSCAEAKSLRWREAKLYDKLQERFLCEEAGIAERRPSCAVEGSTEFMVEDWTWDRGFIGSVTVDSDKWVKSQYRIARINPLHQVLFADIEPAILTISNPFDGTIRPAKQCVFSCQRTFAGDQAMADRYDSCILPDELWVNLVVNDGDFKVCMDHVLPVLFNTEAEAVKALSDAALRYARSPERRKKK